MKNLVTGASGLVGIHIALDLLTKGETVYATYTQNSNLENVKKVFDFYKSANLFEKINWIEMNLEDITQVFDGVKEQKFSLNRSYQGLYIPNGLWRHMENFATNTLVLVICNTNYNENDYIRNKKSYIDENISI